MVFTKKKSTPVADPILPHVNSPNPSSSEHKTNIVSPNPSSSEHETNIECNSDTAVQELTDEFHHPDVLELPKDKNQSVQFSESERFKVRTLKIGGDIEGDDKEAELKPERFKVRRRFKVRTLKIGGDIEGDDKDAELKLEWFRVRTLKIGGDTKGDDKEPELK